LSTYAEFRAVKPAAVENGLKEIVVFRDAIAVPDDVYAYGREAGNSFCARRYIATITLASAMVEIILNKDSRMARLPVDWWNLNRKLLKKGRKNGLPIDRLLSEGESLQGKKEIEFVDLRNRLAHGNLRDLMGFEHTGTTDYSGKARKVALDHLRKSDEFLVEWYNTSPDVQEGRIMHGRWPT